MSVLDLPPRPKDTIPIVTEGPFCAGYRHWQLLPPQDALVLVVKSSFSIVPGGLATPLGDQLPLLGDIHYDDDLEASLSHASDFAPFKPRADILLVGHAYPPLPRARVVNVQLYFGTALSVALAAIGDREWQGGQPSEPKPFARIPLRYERAFGGPGFAANPVGIGTIDGIPGARLPNLERPDRLIRSQGEMPQPICFGPVPASWAARRAKLGTYDEVWLRERWPYFPRNFDWSYFNVASAEQQIAYPRGDEEFHLGGVHPQMQVVSGRLPGLVPRAFAQLGGEQHYRFREITLHLDTVLFDADAMQMSLVFRGLMDVSDELAPEVERLFVTADDLRAPMSIEAAQQRFFALVAPSVPAVPSAPSPVEDKSFGAGPVPAPPSLDRAALVALCASGASLAGTSLFGCDLSDMDFSGRDMRGAILRGAELHGAKFVGTDLRGAVLSGASALYASFRGADLRSANLAEAMVEDVDFSGASLEGASLAAVKASRTRFSGASLGRVNFTDAELESANFDEAELLSADFSGARLSGASFRRAKLDDAQIYDAVAEGCRFDDASMERFRAEGAKLGKSVFERAKAKEANFQAADLKLASFLDADLSLSVFAHADLERAVLHRALAKGARFRHARLVRAQAIKADFMEANFESANMAQADLRGANLHAVETLKAVLDGIQLDQAIVTGSKLEKA